MKVNMGSGKDFRQDFLNLDVDRTWGPDIVVDLEKPFPQEDSQTFITERFGEIEIKKGMFDLVVAYDVLEHLSNLVVAMKTCLDLLREGGLLDILVPYDLSHGAWQDPTHVRAFNEKSWLYYSEWFWYLGWSQARFSVEKLDFDFSDMGKRLLEEPDYEKEDVVWIPRAVDSMRVLLKKVSLSQLDLAFLRNFRQRAIDSGKQ
jgi:SAM-dependent methyltransferase